MKKIAFFSKNLEIGGMEKALVSLVNSLIEQYKVYLFLEEVKGPLLKKINKKIIVREYKQSCNKYKLFRKIINFSKRMKFYLKYKNRFDFACCYATYSVICSRLALIASENNAIYIHSNYVKMYKKNQKDIKNFFQLISVKKFKKCVFVSTESKNDACEYIDNMAEKSYIINNMVDGKEIIKKAKEKVINYFDDKFKILLFVGRLDNTSKNFKLLLNTFYELQKISNEYKLYILGSGPDKKFIKSLINRYKLEKSVLLIDANLNPYKFMDKAEAIILTSYYEGFPVIFLEALILNKKVFTTISVSDTIVNTKDYFIDLEYNPKNNAKIIISKINNKSDYGFDYKKYNSQIKSRFIYLMEEK